MVNKILEFIFACIGRLVGTVMAITFISGAFFVFGVLIYSIPIIILMNILYFLSPFDDVTILGYTLDPMQAAAIPFCAAFFIYCTVKNTIPLLREMFGSYLYFFWKK